ncbi:MAG: AMP-binding protein [Ruminococcus sp.]|jgi:acetyl-CoA synthetase|nr:AMP-binding protein [Ruminococcus sp.]
MKLKNFNEQFVIEKYDENGLLNVFDINAPDNFNYAYDVIDKIAEFAPDKKALLWCNEDEERTFTYKELSEKSNQVANLLVRKGVKKGDMVLCVLKRHYQIWLTILALEKVGAVLIPATNQLMAKDYAYRFKAGNVKFVVATTDNDVPKHITESFAEYGGIAEKFSVKGSVDDWVDFDTEYQKESTVFERIENKLTDPLLAFFSSGTTGYPKMVVHDHSYALAHLITAKHWHCVTDESLHLTISESGWGKFFWGKIYGEMLMGATVFAYDFDRFDADKVLSRIEKYKITSLCCPPTMFRFFTKDGGLEKYDLSSLVYATTAGEALNPEVFNAFKELTGITLMEGFGQTETVLSIGNLRGTQPRIGSMGKPIPLYDVDIVNEDGDVIPTGETGEIVIRIKKDTPNYGLFEQYYGNPEATAETKRDGLYHTGDTAYKDEDGYYWYVGRTDDVIKSSGYRIGPFEIESVMMEHPAVFEVAVTGVKHPVRGQVVKATVVLTKEYKGKSDDALIKELQTYVKTNTAPYKYPRIIEFVDELPKTISGKIRRVEIRAKDNS